MPPGHLPDGVLGAQESPEDVDAEHFQGSIRIDFVDPADRSVDAGVVDQPGNRAEFGPDLFEHAFDLGLVPDVGLDRDGGSPVVADFRYDRFGLIGGHRIIDADLPVLARCMARDSAPIPRLAPVTITTFIPLSSLLVRKLGAVCSAQQWPGIPVPPKPVRQDAQGAVEISTFDLDPLQPASAPELQPGPAV